MCKSCSKSGVKVVLLGGKEVCPDCVLKEGDEQFQERLQWSFNMALNNPAVLISNAKRYPINLEDKPIACCNCGSKVEIALRFENIVYCLPCSFSHRKAETLEVYNAVTKAGI